MPDMIAIADQPYFGYHGDRPDWLIALSQTRDSDTLEQSNYAAMLAHLMAAEPDNVATERCRHYLCGWVEHILVKPGSAAADMAQVLRGHFEDYPVLDEEDWSHREYEVIHRGVTQAVERHLWRSSSLIVSTEDCEDIASRYLRDCRHEYTENNCRPEFATDNRDELRSRDDLARAIRSWRNDKRRAA